MWLPRAHMIRAFELLLKAADAITDKDVSKATQDENAFK